MIGVPGAGKSYFLSQYADALFPKDSTVYISSDEVRAELFPGKEFNPEQNFEVWEGGRGVKARLARELLGGKSVVVDATFANRGQRYDFIRFAREKGAEKVEGFFLDVPLEIALERNKQREGGVEPGKRLVMPEAVEGMHRQITEIPPGMTDGFDAMLALGPDLKPVYEKFVDPEDSTRFITRELQ